LPSSGNKAENYLRERFEVDTSKLKLKQINGDFWLTSSQTVDLEFETEGVRAVRVMDIGLKPTTYLLQLLDEDLSKNVVEIDEDELKALAKENGMIERDLENKGYVGLKFEDRIIGCGFYMDGLVSSKIPEGRMEELINLI
jgi:NOL1/NOP2/fmu family ribosome biogenesis protein